MNKVMLVGRLVRDANFTDGEKRSRINFVIAVNRSYGPESDADFIPVVSFGKPGNGLAKLSSYLVKGKQVMVEGRLNINYDPANKKSWVAVVTDRVELLGGGPKKAAPVAETTPEVLDPEEEIEEETPAPAPAPSSRKPAAKPQPAAPADSSGYVSF